MSKKIWTCKIGELDDELLADDASLRQAVEAAYRQLTGRDSEFCFSGWGGTLTAVERGVVGGEASVEVNIATTGEEESTPVVDALRALFSSAPGPHRFPDLLRRAQEERWSGMSCPTALNSALRFLLADGFLRKGKDADDEVIYFLVEKVSAETLVPVVDALRTLFSSAPEGKKFSEILSTVKKEVRFVWAGMVVDGLAGLVGEGFLRCEEDEVWSLADARFSEEPFSVGSTARKLAALEAECDRLRKKE